MQISPAISLPRVPATQFANQRDANNADGEQIGRRSQANDERSAGRSNRDRQSGPGRELSEQEQRAVEELKRVDREVRAHEAAHLAAAGSLGSGPTYTYKSGPDGKQYVVGGEVRIDTSSVPNDPEATIRKMQQVRRAALAPAEPSAQDRSVASQAARTQAEARAELLSERTAELTGEDAETQDIEQSEQSPAVDAETSGPFAEADNSERGSEFGAAFENVIRSDQQESGQRFEPAITAGAASGIDAAGTAGETEAAGLGATRENSKTNVFGRPSLLPNVNAIQTAVYANSAYRESGGNLVDVFA